MTLIQCSDDCIYQIEGYCKLENASSITSSSGKQGCLHYKSRQPSGNDEQTNPDHADFN